MKRSFLIAASMLALASPAFAEWQPDGPIRLWIGYGAGGGTDVQGRTLAKEIEARRGWKVVPENKAGEDGTVMSAQLKSEAPDGQTLGFAITTTYDFAPMNSDNLSPEDFTYITTTAGSQMAVLARADSGWETLEDLQAAAVGGEQIVWANWGTQVEAGAELVARGLNISVNHLRTQGGKGALNALVSMDANVGWGGGVQKPLVEAGVLKILGLGRGDAGGARPGEADAEGHRHRAEPRLPVHHHRAGRASGRDPRRDRCRGGRDPRRP